MQPTISLHRSQIFAAILLAALTLPGCTGSAPQVEPSAAAPTAADVSPTAIPTLAQTALPMQTLVPRFTPTPRLITPAAAEGTVVDRSMVSPDGNWTALPAYENLPSGYHISLSVFDKERKTVWTPVDTLGEGLGYTAPVPIRWSADSRTFYYSESAVSDGCADFSPAVDVWQSLDVETGKVTPFPLPEGRGHQMSPDETLLAYSTLSAPLELVLMDLSTQDGKQVELLTGEDAKDAQGGRVLWSPAGDELMLAVQTGKVCEGQEPAYYLLLVKVEGMEVRSLYQGEDYLAPLKWDGSGKILVTDWSRRSWWMDAASGEVTTAP